MKHLILSIFLFTLILSCKDQAKQEEVASEPEMETEAEMEETDELQLGCYEYNADGNVVKMKITNIEGNNVEGNLSYALAEKDKNTGTFKGTLNDDKVIGKYRFMSEGVESVRDIAFKVEKDQLVEGFGDLDETGTTFTDTNSIRYNSTTPWQKTVCED